MKKKRVIIALVIVLPGLAGLVLAEQNRVAQEKQKQQVEMVRRDMKVATSALRTLCNEWAATDKKSQGKAKPQAIQIQEICAPPKNHPPSMKIFTCESATGAIRGRCATNVW